MEDYFTGIDYLLYSHKSNKEVIEQFNKALIAEGYQYKKGDDKPFIKEYSDFFYYKSQRMYDTHLKLGYNTRLNGEGCIYLYTGAESLDSSFIVPDTMDVKHNFYQYVWFMGDYYFYALRLPGDINHCPFSKRIFNILAKISKE